MTRNKKNEAQKKGAESHHAASNDRQKQKGKTAPDLPALKRMLNLHGLVYERGSILPTPRLDTKFRDALCHGMKHFVDSTIDKRMNELFQKLCAHRESLREETGRYEDQESLNVVFFEVSWTKRQKLIIPEDLGSFVYAILEARARAVKNPIQDSSLSRQKMSADLAEKIDNLIQLLGSKQSLHIPRGQALGMEEDHNSEEGEEPQYKKLTGVESGFFREALDALEQDIAMKQVEDSIENARIQAVEKSLDDLTIEDEME